MPEPSAGVVQGATEGADVFLHVGPHKTGTTTIQSLLLEGHFDGVYSPEMVPGGQLEGHHELAWAFLPDGPETARRLHRQIPADVAVWVSDQLEASTQMNKPLLLSSEEFSYLKPEDVQSLLKMFSGRRVTVIGVWRNCRDAFASLEAEHLKNGYFVRSQESLDELLREPAVNFPDVLAAWSSKCPFVFIRYPEDDSLVSRFSAVIGTKAEGPSSGRRRNLRIPERYAPIVELFYEKMRKEPVQVFAEDELARIMRHAIIPLLIWSESDGALSLSAPQGSRRELDLARVLDELSDRQDQAVQDLMRHRPWISEARDQRTDREAHHDGTVDIDDDA